MPITALTIPDLVRQRAASDGDRVAYTFLSDGADLTRSITWLQLHRRASELATAWHARGVAGQPVLLALASGLRFVEALIACWYAGAIAVPVSLPRHARVKHRLDRVVLDAGARFVVSLEDTRPLFEGMNTAIPSAMTWLDPCEAVRALPNDSLPFAPDQQVPQQVALLQYTSGSTGSPRGVIVTHANLMHNSALIARACGHGPGKTIGGWLPLFHDMGLIGLLVQSAYSGAACVFMSPERFLMRPWLWLQMISDFHVCSSPAPNFAYDLCVDRVTEEQKAGLDLSRWTRALNGAEPVRTRTLERFAGAFASCGFSRTAFFPCYGLAEATLLVTGPVAQTPGLIDAAGRAGCGSQLGDTQLAIVDPQELRRVPHGQVGEIWVASGSCAQGYWNDPATTQAVFKARLCGADKAEDQGDWLRTGDLGYVQDGQLFVTGRIRDLIIIAGRNFFPTDLEQTIETANPAIALSGVAAFSIDVDHTERLVVAVELRRSISKAAVSEGSLTVELADIRRQIIAALIAGHGVKPHDIVLLRAGALPKTTSGKLRRGAAREQYLGQTLVPFVFPAARLITESSSTDRSTNVACS